MKTRECFFGLVTCRCAFSLPLRGCCMLDARLISSLRNPRRGPPGIFALPPIPSPPLRTEMTRENPGALIVEFLCLISYLVGVAKSTWVLVKYIWLAWPYGPAYLRLNGQRYALILNLVGNNFKLSDPPYQPHILKTGSSSTWFRIFEHGKIYLFNHLQHNVMLNVFTAQFSKTTWYF